MNLYQANIMDHYRNPRHRQSLADPDVFSQVHNPSCGDSLQIEFKIIDSHIVAAGFSGSGCVISQAMASMLLQVCVNKTVQQVKEFNQETLRTLLGMDLGPTRLKCALLSLEAVQSALSTTVS